MTARAGSVHRRDWLRSALVVAGVGRLGLGSYRADAIEQIQDKARAARMQPFESSQTEHFHGVGDAPAAYRLEALRLCESFATDYFAHFRAKGFAIDWPGTKLPVVILASPTSYAAFEQGFADEAVGGHFDLQANWLVTFDYRSLLSAPRGVGSADPRLDNTLALVHETFHQLSYNTGLLDRQADLPLCLAEGLAEYAETWRPARKDVLGSVNRRRRLAIEQAQKAGSAWIPVRTLLTEDALQDGEKTAQAARGESWLLAYKLLKDPSRLVQLRDYLKAVQKANNPAQRVELATTHFGDLDKLDREIRR